MKRFNSIHPYFRLNGKKISQVSGLLKEVENNFPDHLVFLQNWFNNEENIILRTSGSTGKPKKITFKKSTISASARRSITYFKLPSGTKALHKLHPDFVAGKLMWIRALEGGWNLHIEHPSEPFSGENFDFSAFVPRQVEKNIEQIEKINKLLIGGSPVSGELANILLAKKNFLFHTYGMTETLTHIAVKPLNEPACDFIRQKTGGCITGYYHALPGVRFLKTRDNRLIVEDNVLDLKITTNDLVELLNPQVFQWLGRSDWVINSGGIKILPEQVENKLAPFLENRFIIAGKNDITWGEKVILIIEKEIPGHLEEIFKLAGLEFFEKPKEIIVWERFPETSSGKINRKAIIGTYSKNK